MDLNENSLQQSFEAVLTKAEKTSLGIRLSAAFLAGGILIISYLVEYLDPGQVEVAGFLNAIAAILAGIPVMWNAWMGIKSPNLHSIADLLVSVALLAAWVAGDLRSATIIPLIMVIGHVLEDRSMIGSKEAISALAKLTEKSVTRIKNTTQETISAKDLIPGDIILIRPGEKISADGILIEGKTSLDTAPLTGESVPVEVKKGDIVRAGAINLYGLIKVEVSGIGDKTALGRIVELLKEAEQSKPPVTRVLEQHAGSYLPLTIAISLITLFITGDIATMMAVLVVCCPCALAISAPATTIAGLAAASRHGILIKGTAFLEQLAQADTMIFDKTGTLTTGRLNVVDIKVFNGFSNQEVHIAAASLASHSKHPVSKSLASAIKDKDLKETKNLTEVQGLGVRANIDDGTEVIIGRASLLRENGIKVETRPNHFGPLVACSIGDRFAGWFLLQDTLRPEAESVLNNLKNLGIKKTVLVSGDHKTATNAVSEKLPLSESYFEKLPHEKLSIIKNEIKNGNRPVMVGDGINDALALKAGAVGIAIGGTGTDVALASSDIVLLTPDLTRIETMIRLSRKCRKTITVNIVIAMVWTLIMFIAAAGGFIGPVTASLFHNVGTFFVIANSGRLLSFNELANQHSIDNRKN